MEKGTCLLSTLKQSCIYGILAYYDATCQLLKTFDVENHGNGNRTDRIKSRQRQQNNYETKFQVSIQPLM